MWNCCNKPGNAKGCQISEHKEIGPRGTQEASKVGGNLFGFDESSASDLSAGKKRALSGTGQVVSRPVVCKQCKTAFDLNRNEDWKACVWHPGTCPGPRFSCKF